MNKVFFFTAALSATTCLYSPYTTAAITDNIYIFRESSSSDYNLIVPQIDKAGIINEKYYKMILIPDNFSTTLDVSWQELSAPESKTDVVNVELPGNDVRYFKYTFSAKPEQTVFNAQQLNLSGDVNAHFINSRSEADGGALRNVAGSTIGNVTGSFLNNHSDYGGAIFNNGDLGLITGDFIGNNTRTHVLYPEVSDGISSSTGGAIMNSSLDRDSLIAGINGNFIGNYVNNPKNISFGGAISNNSRDNFKAYIGDIYGNFIGNYLTSERDVHGGAIYNGEAEIGNIKGDFIGNYAYTRDLHAQGGAIYNSPYNFQTDRNPEKSVIGDITGNFIGNYASSTGDYTLGGSIANFGRMGKISGDFYGNYAEDYHLDSKGGAIYNGGIIDGIEGNFVGNYVYSAGKYGSMGLGGALVNSGKAGNITGNFLRNYVEIPEDTKLFALGGAVGLSSDTTFVAAGQSRFFSDNYTQDHHRGKLYNAVFVSNTWAGNHPLVTFDTSGGGSWVINDNLEGGYTSYSTGINYNPRYRLLFKGDDIVNPETGLTSQYVAINNDIINAEEISVEGTTLRFGTYEHEDKTAKNWDGRGSILASLNNDGTANREAESVTALNLRNHGVFHIANGYHERINLKSLSSDNGFMHIDVDPDNMTADVLDINGNVEGVTNLIVHASSDTDIRNRGSILFAQSTNDATGNSGSFIVSRVFNSPYLYNVAFDRIRAGDSLSHTWEFAMNDTVNPDPEEPEEPDIPDVPDPIFPVIPDNPKVVPEIPAYQGLPSAALEQTRSMIDNVAGQVSKVSADYNLWANTAYYTSHIDAPVEMDSNIWGLEAGADLCHQPQLKLGVFVSYRDGRYDLDGSGKHYYSPTGSKIDIDSYLGGLYYRYDNNNLWAFATVYGGVQKAHLKTDDGIKSDTDGTQFGGSLEVGYDYTLRRSLVLTPSLGAYYTQINFDAAEDSAGKRAVYGKLNEVELEAGLKLSKIFNSPEGVSDLYLKPSLVQTIVNGDTVRITGLNKVDTVDDRALGRIEVGGRYNFTAQFSAYAWTNYTFGRDYDAANIGIGLNYSW